MEKGDILTGHFVDASCPDLYALPDLPSRLPNRFRRCTAPPTSHMTGHGNVVFTPVEVQNLREYLLAGGFLHADDNYDFRILSPHPARNNYKQSYQQ